MLSTITIIILAVALVYVYVKLKDTQDTKSSLKNDINFYISAIRKEVGINDMLKEKLSYLTPAENKKLEARIAKGKVVKTKTKKTK